MARALAVAGTLLLAALAAHLWLQRRSGEPAPLDAIDRASETALERALDGAGGAASAPAGARR